MFCEGVIFEIDHIKGIERIQNELETQRAIQALEDGETVALTVRGRIVSIAHLAEDEDTKRIVEEPVK